VAQDDTFIGQLGERPVHWGATDAVQRAQLVLGRHLAVGAVAAREDRLQQHRLELHVDGERVARVDRALVGGVRPGSRASPMAIGTIVPWHPARLGVIVGGT
jgi:hypothetical protein